jgi:hypothetical protein
MHRPQAKRVSTALFEERTNKHVMEVVQYGRIQNIDYHNNLFKHG